MRLELHHISKSYPVRSHAESDRLLALQEVSLAVNAGEFVTLIGASGSGKSTLCNLIAGLLTPDSGQILLDGMVITGKTGNVGYMPQRDLLLPWRTVLKNVILGAEIDRMPVQEVERSARELLPLFGLSGFESSYPNALSGGMRQRAALLRTFLQRRAVMLLDEPFGALDALTRYEMQNWLIDIWSRFNLTILCITHDVAEAVMLADRVLVLSRRPGKIAAEVEIPLPRPRRATDEAVIRLQASLLYALAGASNTLLA
ncbi:MAG: ABC transporter ATP-binding protein [Anaerolineae bacterium]